jgi:hypothetical protein
VSRGKEIRTPKVIVCGDYALHLIVAALPVCIFLYVGGRHNHLSPRLIVLNQFQVDSVIIATYTFDTLSLIHQTLYP